MKKWSGHVLHQRIREILESARSTIARSVNTTQVIANWLIGREIVEAEQKGNRRAEYGRQLVTDLAERLTVEYGKGYSQDNLFWFRRLYQGYPRLMGEKFDALRQISASAGSTLISVASCAPRHSSWKPGLIHPDLSWTHYRSLLRADKPAARAFYEIEAVRNSWSARELDRQMSSLLYERLALTRDRKGLMRLAMKGQEIRKPMDVFKDPVVMEFLDLPESPKLVETELEQALIGNLQSFLLEMGRGFAFVARQERLTLEGDHFYADLVFYHTILKCYVILDLKAGKLTHQDLGQLQLYVNYYDGERRSRGDNPTLGVILCTEKNDAVVRYTLGSDQRKTIFAARYRLHLPSEAELRAELRREMRALNAPILRRVRAPFAHSPGGYGDLDRGTGMLVRRPMGGVLKALSGPRPRPSHQGDRVNPEGRRPPGRSSPPPASRR